MTLALFAYSTPLTTPAAPLRAFALIALILGAVACDSSEPGGETQTAVTASPVALRPTAAPTLNTTSPSGGGGELSRPAFNYKLTFPNGWFYRGSGPLTAEILDHELLGFFAAPVVPGESIPPGEAFVTIRVAANPSGLPLDEWVDEGGTERSPASMNTSRVERTISGQRAVEISATPGLEGDVDLLITYVALEDRVYSLWLDAASNEDVAAHRDVYDSILSSFEFTP